jgi:anti-sigma factor (TIGR02949 family)
MTLDSAMDCEEARRLIPFFLDDELDAEQSLLMEVHVSACENCQKELQQEGELRLALRRAAQRVVAPQSFTATHSG